MVVGVIIELTSIIRPLSYCDTHYYSSISYTCKQKIKNRSATVNLKPIFNWRNFFQEWNYGQASSFVRPHPFIVILPFINQLQQERERVYFSLYKLVCLFSVHNQLSGMTYLIWESFTPTTYSYLHLFIIIHIHTTN